MRTEADVAAMLCPMCRVPLAMSDRQGIEIDYCPQCRGVWLDRGELDKIIERSGRGEGQAEPARPSAAPLHQGGGHARDGYGHGGHGDYGHGKPYKRRKNWLEDIFD